MTDTTIPALVSTVGPEVYSTGTIVEEVKGLGVQTLRYRRNGKRSTSITSWQTRRLEAASTAGTDPYVVLSWKTDAGDLVEVTLHGVTAKDIRQALKGQ